MNFYKAIKDRIQGKALKGQRRSSAWARVRRQHLKKNPVCELCGSKKNIEVHHIIPFYVAPDMELTPRNLMTLCENGRFMGVNCHLWFGHLGNYRNVNTSVEADVAYWKAKIRR